MEKKPSFPNLPEIKMTPEFINEIRIRFRPIGSGPLSVMRWVVALCEAIAKDRGWDLDEVENENLWGWDWKGLKKIKQHEEEKK